ncbi:unnamed protein product, partial [Thlaspi arvense]
VFCSRKVLVTHENLKIDITRKNLRCLRPCQWLDDQVTNIYLEFLKEREVREPKKFLRCHFFNTFLFKKLDNRGTGYNYNNVRRCILVKMLEYHLIDCDKTLYVFKYLSLFIWTLAVINVKDNKFQYLDSLKGSEPKIFDALVVFEKFDCGRFMLKYINFYNRGLDLFFT